MLVNGISDLRRSRRFTALSTWYCDLPYAILERLASSRDSSEYHETLHTRRRLDLGVPTARPDVQNPRPLDSGVPLCPWGRPGLAVPRARQRKRQHRGVALWHCRPFGEREGYRPQSGAPRVDPRTKPLGRADGCAHRRVAGERLRSGNLPRLAAPDLRLRSGGARTDGRCPQTGWMAVGART